ncbi:hypothetical protein ZV20_09965 [Salmonella enterica subsp. enterica serovar Give]|uniref:Uncharacterized protein n=2 Tax=Salmonella enterica I TaxID=59201 RepID=A0A6X8RQK5_SALET|nr:hypothetical protein [Salmonella enterica subsp. enterica serovar Give]EAA9022323.1 hypothetical protein [Salmonella enterica]EBG6807669.1 hypothetical protein [Salmonella enterica subsp. enterica]EBW7473927.1 hypothetical protein [Salmonella enterica subsp. enterica serovar Binza]EDU6232473.1 hypothetical protein [Salmonella enterica subsp. enterica serovar Newbrunswick]EDX3648581.1 hypothetical protein [Salmonella enterica subsp. enterica serovar O rough]EED6035985.1 hypothetical protein
MILISDDIKTPLLIVAVAQAESPRFVNVAAEVAGPCSVDTAQSGTESFNCPDRDNLCDLCHINIGGREVIDVILITKWLCKKTTNLIFSS